MKKPIGREHHVQEVAGSESSFSMDKKHELCDERVRANLYPAQL